MQLVTLVGYGGFALVSLVVGLRVLRVALRTHQVPEWALGLVLFVAGGVGYPLLFLRSLTLLPDEVRAATFAAGIGLLSVGSGALYLFNWRVFRPEAPWAPLLFTAGLFVLAWSFLAELALSGFHGKREATWYLLGSTTRALPYGWGALESALRWLRLRGRVRRGEGDPVAVNRLALWALAMSIIFAMYAIGIASGVGSGDTTTHDPRVVALTATLGLPAAAALGLAITPPEAWRRRLQRRKGVASGAEPPPSAEQLRAF